MSFFKFSKIANIHIAIFGDTGSGKTLLLSTFYAYQNSNKFASENRYKLLATTTGQGNRLLNNYYELEQHKLPEQTNKNYEEFTFQVKVDEINRTGAHITWYDYPGEWWSNDPSTGEETKRRKELFKKLANCDISLLLVDGAYLRKKENRSNYISKLFRQFTDEIERQFPIVEEEKDDKKNLVRIPKIWVICLTKSDLLGDTYTCDDFKKDIHSCDETENLRKALQRISIDAGEVSLGNDFLKLSSANIDIEKGVVKSVGNPVGVDLILPIAVKAPLVYIRRKKLIKRKILGFATWVIDFTKALSENYLDWFTITINIKTLDEFLSTSSKELQQQLDEAIKSHNAVDFIIKSFMRKMKYSENAKDIYLSLK